MQRLVIGCFAVALLVVGVPAFAQKQNPFVGTWEVVESTTTLDGKARPDPPLFKGITPGIDYWIYAPDGFYMTSVVPKPLPAKAGRFCFGLKVRLRLKPPEESPA